MSTTIGEMNTRVTFYEFQPNDGPEPGENETNPLYECWASVQQVWMRDLEQAKANNTLEDLTFIMRDPRGEFIPQKSHYVGINEGLYFGKRYNVKSVRPDLRDKRLVTVIAGLVS